MNSQQNEQSGKWRHLFEVLVAVDVFAFGGVLKPVDLTPTTTHPLTL